MSCIPGCEGSRMCGAIQSGFCQFHSASALQMNCSRLGHQFARPPVAWLVVDAVVRVGERKEGGVNEGGAVAVR